jgi:hypothetical protein
MRRDWCIASSMRAKRLFRFHGNEMLVADLISVAEYDASVNMKTLLVWSTRAKHASDRTG